jgi:uncharacterized repeat protein (TIGR02543 family)
MTKIPNLGFEKPLLKNLIIGNNVTSIGNEAFYGCTGLTTIEIPGSVTSIGNYAFSGCTGLTTIEIPESVTSIGDSAFSYCTGLTSVTFQGTSKVTSIGDSSFSGCTGLTSVKFRRATPPSFYDFTFLNTPKSYTIYVPIGSKSLYQAVSQLSGYNIVEFGDGPTIFTVTFNTNGGSAVISQTVNIGNKSVKPSDPKRSGYTFGGWYANSACTTAFNFNTSITANITLYAKWNPVVQIRLGDVDGKPGISISDALEIFKYLAGMKSTVKKGTSAWNAALITPASQKSGKPGIGDALEIFKKLAGMKSLVK